MLNFVAKVHGSENAGHLEQILWPHILIQFYITLSTMRKTAECTGKVGTLEACTITLHLLALRLEQVILISWRLDFLLWTLAIALSVPVFLSLIHTHLPTHTLPHRAAVKKKKGMTNTKHCYTAHSRYLIYGRSTFLTASLVA